jgi:hypothetical protein
MKNFFIDDKKNDWIRKMGKKYDIPEKALRGILKRDRRCVYCHKEMRLPKNGTKQRNWATIEHMSDKAPWNDPKTISMCCGSCNSSRRMGFKKWFKTQYCLDRGINEKNVAKPVRAYMNMIDLLSPRKRKKFVLQNY